MGCQTDTRVDDSEPFITNTLKPTTQMPELDNKLSSSMGYTMVKVNRPTDRKRRPSRFLEVNPSHLTTPSCIPKLLYQLPAPLGHLTLLLFLSTKPLKFDSTFFRLISLPDLQSEGRIQRRGNALDIIDRRLLVLESPQDVILGTQGHLQGFVDQGPILVGPSGNNTCEPLQSWLYQVNAFAVKMDTGWFWVDSNSIRNKSISDQIPTNLLPKYFWLWFGNRSPRSLATRELEGLPTVLLWKLAYQRPDSVFRPKFPSSDPRKNDGFIIPLKQLFPAW